MKPAEVTTRRAFPPLIILAGGRSARFGSPKGLAEFNGRTLLAAHVSSYPRVSGLIVVVVGYHAKTYADEVVRLSDENPDDQRPEIVCMINEDPDRGPFSSIQTGLASFHDGCPAGVFVQPVDAGPASGWLLEEMVRASRQGELTVVPVFEGKGGHPVLLSSELAGLCSQVDPAASGARLDHLLRDEKPDRIVRLPVRARSVLQNFNFPSDLPRTPS